jgi:hypothetical protein
VHDFLQTGEVRMTTQQQEIQWVDGFDQALARARELGRPVLLDFSAAPM